MLSIKYTISLILFSLLIFFPSLIKATTYSTAEVATHNLEDDCFMIFEDSVYDITDYLASHDRYLDIRLWCGKDMTEEFKTKDGLDRDHKSSSYALLENYKIGQLNALTTIVPTLEVSETPEDEEYSVEIEGQEMKILSIQEIAELWQIDAQSLLNRIISEFNLTGEYTVASILDSLRDEYPFSPAQIKGIAEAIKQGESEPVAEVNNTAKNPYNFGILLISTLSLYWIWYLLTKRNLKQKIFKLTVFNMFWNSILLLSLIPAAGFGLFMVIRYSFPELYKIDFDFLYWHVEGAIIMALVAISHFLTRLNAYLAQLKLTLITAPQSNQSGSSSTSIA